MSFVSQKARTPELETLRCTDTSAHAFDDQLGKGCVRYIEHGVPHAVVRWHYHDEYELHLITETRGRAFVGDYIGTFEPGHVVLTGPRLPHNWVSHDIPAEGIAVRDRVLQFPDSAMREIMRAAPEMKDVGLLLDRSLHGIEFFGMSERVGAAFDRIRVANGIVRFAEFVALLGELTAWPDYRLLSAMQLQGSDDDAAMRRIGAIVAHITAHCEEPGSLAEASAREGMSESSFSRYFHRATGNTYTEFVNRLRISRACNLLMQSDQYITNIAYDVGYRNVGNFNRQFMRIKGTTPREFRRQSQARFGQTDAA